MITPDVILQNTQIVSNRLALYSAQKLIPARVNDIKLLGFSPDESYKAYCDINWQFFNDNGFSPNIVLFARLISDNDFLRESANSASELNDLLNKIKKNQITVAGISGAIAAIPTPFTKLLASIGGLISFFEGTKEAQVNSLNAIKDLPEKVFEVISQQTSPNGVMQIIKRMFDLIDQRPKCQSPTQACINEHINYTVRIKLFAESVKFWIAINQTFSSSLGWEQLLLQKKNLSGIKDISTVLPQSEKVNTLSSTQGTKLDFLDFLKNDTLLVFAGLTFLVYTLIKK